MYSKGMKIKLNILMLFVLCGCSTNADWGKYRGAKINNTRISNEALNTNQDQIKQEAQHLNLSVVNYLHKVNTNQIKRVTHHDLLPDPFVKNERR
jgi:hypothetical protein